MKKINFVTEEQVKNLVANGEYDKYGYYLVDIPNQFYNPNNLFEEIQANTAEFQDFLEKAKEEAFHQNKVKGAEQKEDIIYLGYEIKDGRFVLTFTSFKGYLEVTFNNKKITHTIEVKIPFLVKSDGYFKVTEWIRKMVNTVAKKYISDKCRTDVDWKLLRNGNVKFEVIQSPFVSGWEY